jgi:processing peptidase subunit beta
MDTFCVILLQLIGSWDRTHGCGINSPSRLAQRVGFGPELQSYQAFSTCYKDTGLWGVYFVIDRDAHASNDFVKNVTTEWFVYVFVCVAFIITIVKVCA